MNITTLTTAAARLLLVFLILVVTQDRLAGQAQVGDLVYLKNGSIIRGTVLEAIPAGTVRIRASDGSVVVYRFDEVDRIEKESAPRLVAPSRSNGFMSHRRLAVSGLVVSYLVTVVGAAMHDDYLSTTAIPVVGPFATVGRVDRDPLGFFEGHNRGLLITSGVIQTGFLTYLTAGLVVDALPNKKFAVQPAKNARGLALRYRF
jgi:hypothetical protein